MNHILEKHAVLSKKKDLWTQTSSLKNTSYDLSLQGNIEKYDFNLKEAKLIKLMPYKKRFARESAVIPSQRNIKTKIWKNSIISNSDSVDYHRI